MLCGFLSVLCLFLTVPSVDSKNKLLKIKLIIDVYACLNIALKEDLYKKLCDFMLK